MKKIPLVICICIILASCTKNEELAPLDNERDAIEMHLLNMEIGDKFYYTLLSGEEYFNPDNTDFTYLGDTLELEVVGKDGNCFRICERITEFSNMRQDTNQNYYYWPLPEDEVCNIWTIKDSTLLLEKDPDSDWFSSHLFYYDTPRQLNRFSVETKIVGWKTNFPYCECDTTLYVSDYLLQERQYENLNVFINNVHMQVDGPGETTVYNMEQGIVRTSFYSWWTQTGLGWDRINK